MLRYFHSATSVFDFLMPLIMQIFIEYYNV
jgi:hypothetical protein